MPTSGKWHLQILIGEDEELLNVEAYPHYFSNEDVNFCTICEVVHLSTPFQCVHHEYILYALQVFGDENPDACNIV